MRPSTVVSAQTCEETLGLVTKILRPTSSRASQALVIATVSGKATFALTRHSYAGCRSKVLGGKAAQKKRELRDAAAFYRSYGRGSTVCLGCPISRVSRRGSVSRGERRSYGEAVFFIFSSSPAAFSASITRERCSLAIHSTPIWSAWGTAIICAVHLNDNRMATLSGLLRLILRMTRRWPDARGKVAVIFDDFLRHCDGLGNKLTICSPHIAACAY